MGACENRVAIATGAAGNGMGRSIALTLAREGAAVIVNYRTSQERAEAVASHIRTCGGVAVPVQADIATAEGCRQLVARTLEEFGRVDICVIGPGSGWHPAPIDQLDTAAALEDLSREVAPFYHLMPLVLPGMYERRWGRIIGIALHPTKLPPAYAYNAAKAARTHALLLANDEAWRHGVTINVVAPGPVGEVATLAAARELCDHTAAWANRPDVTPQDIAEGVAMLCSETGRFISGCVLPYLFY
jgi:3-oxoacyl-[acyl-carrier protein] reductase